MSETLEDLVVTEDDVVEAGVAEPSPKAYHLLAFTNDRTNQAVVKQLEMFYQIVINNQLAIMHARNDKTGEVETILVGIEREGDATYPLAKILGEADINTYSPPDGVGGYLSDALTEH